MNPSDLRRRRLRIGWSREQLAHAVGVSAMLLRAWEEGTAPVGPATFCATSAVAGGEGRSAERQRRFQEVTTSG